MAIYFSGIQEWTDLDGGDLFIIENSFLDFQCDEDIDMTIEYAP